MEPQTSAIASAIPTEWTTDQELVIQADCGERLLVVAGPGTGKTAVACARVAKLIMNDDVNPSSILMVSFTRTAVAEMRNRISHYVGEHDADAVTIATLDRTAFSMGIGVGHKFANLMGSFDNNISLAIDALKERNEILVEYFREIKHVVLDEAQDLTGDRADLALLLIGMLSDGAGVTIFADHAQAIYGFTSDEAESGEGVRLFLDEVETRVPRLQKLELTEIHRTDERVLLNLFEGARKALFGGGSVKDRILNLVDEIKGQGDSLGSEIQDYSLLEGDLLLYRKRASALIASQHCPTAYRLRLPNYPPAVFPFIGLIFFDCDEPFMDESQFVRLWENRVPPSLQNGLTVESAWNRIIGVAADRKHGISVRRLRELVASSRPPLALTLNEYGAKGPIFSTIHASKGREADRVLLMIPSESILGKLQHNEDDKRLEEEARVYYVGATRAKRKFFHGIAKAMFHASSLDNGGRRIVTIPTAQRKPVSMQVGLAGDIDESLAVSTVQGYTGNAIEAQQLQRSLVSVWDDAFGRREVLIVDAFNQNIAARSSTIWSLRFSCNSKTIGWSAEGLMHDLWSAANRTQQQTGLFNLRPPDHITGMHLIGLRTCALTKDSPLLPFVHTPYCASGFFLAPMIVGYPSFYFKFKGKGFHKWK